MLYAFRRYGQRYPPRWITLTFSTFSFSTFQLFRITRDLRCLWILGFPATSIKIWRMGAFSSSLLSGPLRKQKVVVCDFWSIRFLCFKVHCFWTSSEFDRVFLKSALSFTSIALLFLSSFILKHDKFRFLLQSFHIQKKHRYWGGGGGGVVKTNWHVPANIYFCSFCSLWPPLFDKRSGCYSITVWLTSQKTQNPETFLTT